MPLECGLHDAALDAAPAAVHEPHLPKPRFVRGSNVFLDDRGDVARRERVEIQLRFDGHFVRHGRAYTCFTCSAVTVVVIPPRTVNAPVTVIRRG